MVKIKKGRKRQLILGISCRQVWLPGQYVMIVRDSQDSCSVMRYDFTLDHHLKVKDLSAGRRCMLMSLEDTLSGCLNADNPNWSTVAHVPGSACYRCFFKEPPPAGAVPTCSQAGVLGAIAGMLGTIQAAEALKYILGVGELLTNRLLTFDAKTMNFRTIKVKRRPNCEICGEHPTINHLIDYEQTACDLH